MRNLFDTFKVFKSNFQRSLQNVLFMKTLQFYNCRWKLLDLIVFFSDDWNELKVRVINWGRKFELGFQHVILSISNKVALFEFSSWSMIKFETNFNFFFDFNQFICHLNQIIANISHFLKFLQDSLVSRIFKPFNNLYIWTYLHNNSTNHWTDLFRTFSNLLRFWLLDLFIALIIWNLTIKASLPILHIMLM